MTGEGLRGRTGRRAGGSYSSGWRTISKIILRPLIPALMKETGLRQGACVIFYPEATVTRDPEQWPMAARTGVARLALATGVPVVPAAHWGAQDGLPYGSLRPHLLPRRRVRVRAGPPVDLSRFAGLPLTAPVLREATRKIMADVTGLVAELRHEAAPAKPCHPAIARRAMRRERPGDGSRAAEPERHGV